jgi:hypothetical protein
LFGMWRVRVWLPALTLPLIPDSRGGYCDVELDGRSSLRIARAAA